MHITLFAGTENVPWAYQASEPYICSETTTRKTSQQKLANLPAASQFSGFDARHTGAERSWNSRKINRRKRKYIKKNNKPPDRSVTTIANLISRYKHPLNITEKQKYLFIFIVYCVVVFLRFSVCVGAGSVGWCLRRHTSPHQHTTHFKSSLIEFS